MVWKPTLQNDMVLLSGYTIWEKSWKLFIFFFKLVIFFQHYNRCGRGAEFENVECPTISNRDCILAGYISKNCALVLSPLLHAWCKVNRRRLHVGHASEGVPFRKSVLIPKGIEKFSVHRRSGSCLRLRRIHMESRKKESVLTNLTARLNRSRGWNKEDKLGQIW